MSLVENLPPICSFCGFPSSKSMPRCSSLPFSSSPAPSNSCFKHFCPVFLSVLRETVDPYCLTHHYWHSLFVHLWVCKRQKCLHKFKSEFLKANCLWSLKIALSLYLVKTFLHVMEMIWVRYTGGNGIVCCPSYNISREEDVLKPFLLS